MKLKRLCALGLSLALALSLAIPALGAEATQAAPDTAAADTAAPADDTAAPADQVAFPDLILPSGNRHWAAGFIQDMYERGMAAGLDDGNFYPDRTMSATEALLFCARITGVDKEIQAQIYAARGEEVAAVLPKSIVSWATPELSLAVETGVVTIDELQGLNETAPTSLTSSAGAQPYLLWNISRENVCKYLVRAMQLEPLAQSMGEDVCLSYLRNRCKFADLDDISPDLISYVYVLAFNQILNGTYNSDGQKIVDPKGSVTRAQMMTLVSQALKVMEERGISVELSEYTDYGWAAGVVDTITSEVDGTLALRLTDVFTREGASYAPAANVKIYVDNMLSDAAALRPGKYVRLNLTDDGQVDSIRVGGSLLSYTGKLSSLEGDTLVLRTEESTKTFAMDRFTQVMAGADAGDRTVIDSLAGYTDVQCWVDELGHLAAVKLWGGTSKLTGFINKAVIDPDGSATVTLADAAGTTTVYTVPATADFLVNGVDGILAASHAGRQATLRLTEEGKVTAIDVNTLTAYLQGRITAQRKEGEVRTLTIANANDANRSVSATIDSEAAVTFEGEARSVARIENDWFVTARLEGGVIVELEGYSATATVEGTLTAITYGVTTTLEVSRTDGGSVTYDLDISAQPAITRGGKNSKLSELRTGDSLVISLRYNAVEKIDATPRQADLTGKIAGIASTAAGNSIQVTLADGETVTYTAGAGISITRGGNSATFKDLNVGDAVELVTNGSELLSISVTAAAAVTTDQLTGTVYDITNIGNTRSITLLVAGRADPVEVDLRSSSATLIDRTGRSISLTSLKKGEDTVQVLGSFNGAVFVATLVIKL